MITTELLDGQGLGNQIWCYVVSRAIALNNNYEYGVYNAHKFKGQRLFVSSLPSVSRSYPILQERCVRNALGYDVSPLDKNLLAPPDDRCLMGTMQAEEYIEDRYREVREWLKVKQEWNIREYSNHETCVINVRGGEYKGHPELILPQRFFRNAMKHMNNITGKMLNYIVVTDDVPYAQSMFPELPVKHDCLESDYGIIHNAKYAIISNSSFAWFPMWTSTHNEVCIAPKYWARHNVSDGYWSNGDSLTKRWLWLDRDNNLQTYKECLMERK